MDKKTIQAKINYNLFLQEGLQNSSYVKTKKDVIAFLKGSLTALEELLKMTLEMEN